MNRTGLIVISNLSRLTKSFKISREYVFGTLYVQLYVPKTAPVLTTPGFSEIVQSIYKCSLRHCSDIDVRVLVSDDGEHPVRNGILDIVLLDGWMPPDDVTTIRDKYVSNGFVNLNKDEPKSNKVWKPFDKEDIKKSGSNNVVLGGTFDRLHVGHKILLTEAVIRAKKKLVVGVTDRLMVRSKILCELLQPTEKRIAGVKDFLTCIDSTLEYDIVAIQDPYGPTKSDPDLDLIVVSSETYKGGEKCNEVRDVNLLSKLTIHCVQVIEEEPNLEFKETKISSSNQRMDLLGTRWREPQINNDLPKKPYIVGLIGGAGCYLKKVSEFLAAKGAVIIDCDRVALRKLGKHWAQKSSEWPQVRKTIKNRITALEDANKICVLQGNIILDAEWQSDCHEIWSVIIPLEEALNRLMDGEGKSKEEATEILLANPDNDTLVEQANVVLSTKWDDNFTEIQVNRAWSLLEKKTSDN